MAKSFFDSPLNLDPKAGDMTDIIFKSAQMSLEKRERQRQAIQGVVDTFMTVAKLNQEKTRMEMQDRVAKAGLEFKQQQLEETQKKNAFDQLYKAGVLGHGPMAKAQKPELPTTLVNDDGKTVREFPPEAGKIMRVPNKEDVGKDALTQANEVSKTKALLDIAFNEVMSLAEQGKTGVIGGRQSQLMGSGFGELAEKAGFGKQEKSVQAIEGLNGLLLTRVAKTLGKEAGNLAIQESERLRPLMFDILNSTPVIIDKRRFWDLVFEELESLGPAVSPMDAQAKLRAAEARARIRKSVDIINPQSKSSSDPERNQLLRQISEGLR